MGNIWENYKKNLCHCEANILKFIEMKLVLSWWTSNMKFEAILMQISIRVSRTGHLLFLYVSQHVQYEGEQEKNYFKDKSTQVPTCSLSCTHHGKLFNYSYTSCPLFIMSGPWHFTCLNIYPTNVNKKQITSYSLFPVWMLSKTIK